MNIYQTQLQTQQSSKETKQSKLQSQLNRGVSSVLPPEVEGNTYGHLFIEIGNLEWFIYDGQNYLEQGVGADGKGVNSLFVNTKFWGDKTKGIYLKFANGMKKKEQVINKFKYDIKCPEKSFEKYIDDMGVLIVDIYDSDKSVTIGTSKIFLKLYLKRQEECLLNEFCRAKAINDDSPLLELRGKFPITLTGNQNVKIGEFSISLVSSFIDPFNPKGLQPRGMINLEDSFIKNEELAQQLTKKEQDKLIMNKTYSDDRIPSSLQGRQASVYNRQDFDDELDQKPTRLRPQQRQGGVSGKENQRNLINIDENEDTFHNEREFERIVSRGENLRKQMNDALEQDKAWQTLHGPHEIPKKYVPPFLTEEEKFKDSDSEFDSNVYAIEVEGTSLQDTPNKDQFKNGQTEQVQSQVQPENLHIRDMRFIRMKIMTLQIENEELLHSLIDETFNIIIELPLPDIYQKKVTNQQIKLNNFDIVSFNEFVYNSSALYNFKIDEETFNQLVQSQIKVTLEGKETKGILTMNRVLLAKGYKLEASIPLERTIVIEPEDKKNKQKKKADDPKKKNTKPQKGKEVVAQAQTFTKVVGHLTVAINLQRGDNEEELARDYEMRLKIMQKEKAVNEETQRKEAEKRMRFSMNQETVFAQLYMNIDNVKHLCINNDGTLNKKLHDDSFNLRKAPESLQQQDEAQVDQVRAPPVSIKRNLFVQYKAFPSLEKLKTNVLYHEVEPKFEYRFQSPIVMSPESLEKFEKFTFILEVWDQLSPAKEELIGLVKIPLASFCYSMKTNDNEVFSLNFLADQHCLYPLIIADDYLPIYSPRLAVNVGELKVTLALGTPIQINRQIQKELEAERHLQALTFQAQLNETLRNKELKDQEDKMKRKLEKESMRRLAEEETKKLEPQRSNTPEKSFFNSQPDNSVMKNMANFLKNSINVSRGDLDLRKMTYLHCMRKLFEEARVANIVELNSDEFYKNAVRNFDGSVKKDEFIYAILNREEFTLTRTELSNICSLVLNINRDDNNNIDVDELQLCYQAYLKYYEFIEARILDLLEKFKVNISKKMESPDQIEAFSKQIEDSAVESKMQLSELKELMENNGVFIREALYDQLQSYFDLDRTGNVFIASFCEYLRNPAMKNFNFFKVNPAILATQIGEYVKNSIETNKDSLSSLENEFKVELYRIKSKSENAENIPAEFLLDERINAKLFQFKLKRQGIVMSLWEVFTFFEMLNTQYAKMYYEPQRYHYITFGLFYKFISNEDYEQKIKDNQQVKASIESVFDLAADLNKKRKGEGSSEEGIYSSKSEQDDDEDEAVIIKDKLKKKIKKGVKKEMTFVKEEESIKVSDKSIQMYDLNNLDPNYQQNRPYTQVKHIFDIKVKELLNIPILDYLIKDTTSNTKALNMSPSKEGKKSKLKPDAQYIQNAGVKYSFPLDEEEVMDSDYLELNTARLAESNVYDYKVTMNTVHTYTLKKEDKIQKLFQTQINDKDQWLNISVVLHSEGREFVIGNAHLPIEEIIDVIDTYEIQGPNAADLHDDQKQRNKILFLYGTSYSQRENSIIGKVVLEIDYSTQPLYLSQEEVMNQMDNKDKFSGQSCFMHRETFVNRKIPLNAVLSVQIDRISNLKECLDNIDHFSKIQQSSFKDLQESQVPKKQQTILTGISGKSALMASSRDTIEKRRIFTQIFKEGLNLSLSCSLFDEDPDLKKKFPGSHYQTRLLFNTLNPSFNEVFEQQIQMDKNIFEYLKNKRAVFEVRHYIIQQKAPMDSRLEQFQSKGLQSSQENTQRSQITEDDQEIFERNDFIVLGYVKIPLLSLITKNNGIDGDFIILDDFKQQMGTLKLRISLNHHSGQRPLYSGTNKLHNQKQAQDEGQHTTLIDKTINLSTSLTRGKALLLNEHQYILGINLVELISKNREGLFNQAQISISSMNQNCLLYLKFSIRGQNYQTKFLSNQNASNQSEFMKQIQMRVFDIRRTIFIDIDLSKQREVEEAFAKPLEIQLWFKKDNIVKYKQPEKEVLLGSFFVELNELSKIKNRRLKDSNGAFYSYEGYFCLYEYEKEQIVQDRLGLKLHLVRKEYENQLEDMEVLFHNISSIDSQICEKLDHQNKGYVDLDDLRGAIQKSLQDPYQNIMRHLVDLLEYKNSDKVFYSPFFGLPQPYFRYARRFDSFGIIEKFNKELQALDANDNGFTPVGLFRSLLEHELKIKEKIVDEFIQSMRDGVSKEGSNAQQFQTLDVNVISHTFKNHIDYVVLLRKLVMYYETKMQDASSNNENLLLSGRNKDYEDTESDLILKIEVESAKRLKNPINEMEPPNAFVHLSMPFKQASPSEITTPCIQKNSYPTWHYATPSIKVPLSQDNIKVLMSQGLEFEIYHSRLGSNDKINNMMIGVAYVDLSLFAFVDGFYQIQGYFHVLKKGKYETMDMLTSVNHQRLSQESLGQIKLNIVTSTNIQRILDKVPNKQSLKEQFSPLKQNHTLYDRDTTEYNPFSQVMVNQSFARDQQVMSFTHDQPYHLLNETHQKLESTIKQFGLTLNKDEDVDLKSKLNQSMRDLDIQNKRLMGTLQDEPVEEEKHETGYIKDFTMTRGYNQSKTFQSQIKGLQPYQEVLRYDTRPNQVVDEGEENSELDREENVFNNNMSEASGNKEESNHGTINEEEENNESEEQEQEPYPSTQQNFNATFNQKQGNQFSPQPIRLNQIVDSDGEHESQEDQKVPEQESSLRESQQSLNVFEQANLRQERKQDIKESDDIYDQKEYERISKIFTGKKK